MNATHQLEPLSTATRVMGKQVMTTGMFRSCATAPMLLSRSAAVSLLAGRTCSHYWIGAVLQEEAGSPPGTGAGVAAARMAREVNAMSMENIVVVRRMH